MEPVSLARRRRYHFGAAIPFVLIHAGALAVLLVPFRWSLVAWFAASYALRVFGVTAGHHRYFSHRSYKLGRVSQFLMACLAQTAAQKGVLWWAAHHRDHHRHADAPGDLHSPWLRTFWWAHVGWVLSNEHDGYDQRRVADFARFPELRWLDRHHWVPAAAYGAAIWLVGGWGAFVWGFLLATVAVYHATFAVNSVAHLFGWRRFETPDQSRNSLLLALVTFGEGWHNNHHYSMVSCRQGFRWWEIDITYYGLQLLRVLGIARDLRPFRQPAGKRAA
ncbi:MAG: fatty acid desaturase [Acidobacteriota bacterium]|nr:fatty acid desaturase [Acidobacteriota bacterium]